MKSWTFHCPLYPALSPKSWEPPTDTCAMNLSPLRISQKKKKQAGRKKERKLERVCEREMKGKKRDEKETDETEVMYRHMDTHTHLTMPPSPLLPHIPPYILPFSFLPSFLPSGEYAPHSPPLLLLEFLCHENVNHLYNIKSLWMTQKKKSHCKLIIPCHGRKKGICISCKYVFIIINYYFVWCCFAMQAKFEFLGLCLSQWSFYIVYWWNVVSQWLILFSFFINALNIC